MALMWGHTNLNLWPLTNKIQWFQVESKWTFVPILKKVPQDIHEIGIQNNGIGRWMDVQPKNIISQ